MCGDAGNTLYCNRSRAVAEMDDGLTNSREALK